MTQLFILFFPLTSIAIFIKRRFIPLMVYISPRISSDSASLSFDTLQFRFAMGFEYWRHIDSLGFNHLHTALRQLFPDVSGGGRINRHFIYRPDFKEEVANWTSDLLWQTERIQELLSRYQHPADCSRAAFMIPGSGLSAGLGAVLRQTACIWTQALESGRIFTYGSARSQYPALIGPFCKDNPNGDCLFEPLTNCSITNNSDVIVGKIHNGTYPMWLHEVIRDSMIAHDPYACAWFWKAQVMTYQSRLNNRTRDFIRQGLIDSGIPAELWRPGGFDIGIQIRHSDQDEWRQVSDAEYRDVLMIAKKILGRDPIVFLATDDPTSVTYFQSLPGMKVYAFKGIDRNQWRDKSSRERAGDISSLWA
jgi:hypothetical protein